MAKLLPREWVRFILMHRMLIFLSSMLSMLIIFPLIHENFAGYLIVIELFFSFLLIAGIVVVSDNKQTLTIAILLAVLAFTVIWFNMILQNQNLLIVGLLLEIAFFTITTSTIIFHVLEYKKVTADKIYGAITGYFLIGIIFALIYITIENATPGAFTVLNSQYSPDYDALSHRYYFAHFVYFSYVTQATLGYGDIVPLTAPARMFSALHAVIGQLYVAVLIARLVGLHISHTHLLDRGPRG